MPAKSGKKKPAVEKSVPAVASPPADVVQIRGARQNNLKGIDLDLPLGKLNVITGPSGSGKLSLAFQTIYAEGQRRYVETFSPYTRQFFDRMDKPKVDEIRGIPPAIAIEQSNTIRTTRSTVGTMTEINDYLKLLWPRIAEAECPGCGQAVRCDTAQTVADAALKVLAGETVLVTFPVPVPAKTKPADFFAFLQQQGYLRVWVFGEVVRVDEPAAYKRATLPAVVMVIQDRVTLSGAGFQPVRPAAFQAAVDVSRLEARLPHRLEACATRLTEAIEQAFIFGKGKLSLIAAHQSDQSDQTDQSDPSRSPRTLPFSKGWHCAACDIDIRPPTPALFTFNNAIGACPQCRGFGRTIGLDLDRALPDKSLSIRDGLVKAFGGTTYGESQKDLLRCAKARGVSVDTPFDELPAKDQEWVINGDPGYEADPGGAWEGRRWYGVQGFFDYFEKKAYKMHVRVFLSRYRSYTTCRTCKGKRLQPEALNFKVRGRALPDWWQLPVSVLRPLVEELPLPAGDHTADLVRNEIASRLRYMEHVGLGYLNLDRASRTLSGGEVMRVNLTTCLGASLVNTLFVLDEPSIGLHPRDTGRLVDVMRSLRDKGNTLLVVEHEESVMRAADNLIEIGPGRGELGGELVYHGPLDELEKATRSLTADYLLGRKEIPVPKKRRVLKKGCEIRVVRATQNNLKKLDVSIPLGVFCCVTGVSGSGKSTLVHDVLYENLVRRKGDITENEPGRCKDVLGAEKIAQVVMVDQSPPSRTPRSTPAVYVGAYDFIRQLFAETPDALSQQLTAGYFSFNSGTGRCGRCQGAGYEKVEMQFLSDLYVKCPECEGRRFRPEALRILWNGKSVHEVLEMTITEALKFLTGFPTTEHEGGHGLPARPGRLPAGLPKNEPLPDPIVAVLNNPGTACAPAPGWKPGEAGWKPALPGQSGGLTYSKSKVSAAALRAAAALQILADVGLGYLRLGQPLNTLSGGESQRLKLVGHMLEGGTGHTLFILDEPTTGLHFDDIALLLLLFQRLVDKGHSLLVIEHNMEVIKCADWIVDLGPEAGDEGGFVVAQGTPEQVARVAGSHTGEFLMKVLSAQCSVLSARVQDSTAHCELRTENSIRIAGAREHNLKNLSVEIPRSKFVVVTGLSGSGKSTLAFDIVFAEGQRRFLDSMSTYARQFVEQMERPEVDHISGLPPTVAIEQRISRGGGKSTVATVTEIYHFLRLLYSKVGQQFCPKCQEEVQQQSPGAIAETVRAALKKGAVRLCAPLIRGRKGFHSEVAEAARRQGFMELVVDGKIVPVASFRKLERFKEHTIDAVVATLGREPSVAELDALVAKALTAGRGVIRLMDAKGKATVLNSRRCCPSCGDSFEDLDPRLFSFNSPHGWCQTCRGYGTLRGSMELDTSRAASLMEAELQEEARRERDDDDGEVRQCPSCAGGRLTAEALHVKVHNTDIAALTALPVRDVAKKLKTFTFAGTQLLIAQDIMVEIGQRLKFLDEVGLGYLQLNRSAMTLSGGESQRIRLAAQLGSNLTGVLYVLDEPTIGLHPRDNVALLNTLTALRDKGNSLLVVEHDEETMRRSDYIIDMGPGAGMFGGEIVARGTVAEVSGDAASVTGRVLGKPVVHPSRGSRRKLPALKGKDGWLRVKGATANNLKNIDVSIPSGRLTVITGISGSGKSSFMRGVLYPAVKSGVDLRSTRKNKTGTGGSRHAYNSITGLEYVEAVYEVDQSPIGKTSRSTPATYIKVFDEIRALFAALPAAKMRGYTASRFSFNTEGGRCEACTGNGVIKHEMAFLPTSHVVCEECKGRRYNTPTLEIEYHGKNIGDVMNMTISEAADFFAAHRKIARTLRLLADTGTGYLKLGQPSPTLSGGEAQRLKLVAELSRGVARTENARLRRNQTVKGNLYLIEEPTIGLHPADVVRLVDVLHRLVDDGHTVVVIEHNLDIMAEADCIIDIGPEAGSEGGRVVAFGTPEEVAKSKESRTAPFLAGVLG